MAQTITKWGDTHAQKKWSSVLAVDVAKKSYFTRKFVGRGQNNVIEQKTELESDAGDRVSFDLSVQLRQKPTYGDNRVKGKEENLRFYSDEVIIDQVRHPVSAGGKMSRKRTVHDMRKVAKDRLSDYFKQFVDELHMMYLAGARGINEDFIEDESFTGFAGNTLRAPDAAHIMYGGDATSKATIVADDKMTVGLVERAQTKSKMLRALDPNVHNIQPVSVEGEERYVLLMSPLQCHDMRVDTSSNNWLDIQKAVAGAEGYRTNKIFRGGLGMVNDTVLHEHSNVIRFNDYGAGSDVDAARALFMGRQAGVVAYGTPGGMRYMWKEEEDDYGNEPTVVSGFIGGMQKTTFNDRDFGVISIDTAATDPNA